MKLLVCFTVLGTVLTKSIFELYGSQSPPSLRDSPDWPNVKFPDSFEIQFTINKFNNVTKELESYKNSSAY